MKQPNITDWIPLYQTIAVPLILLPFIYTRNADKPIAADQFLTDTPDGYMPEKEGLSNKTVSPNASGRPDYKYG